MTSVCPQGRLTSPCCLAEAWNMFAKAFFTLCGNGRLTDARTAQTAPYGRYNGHVCESKIQYHPEDITERPWFEHIDASLTDNSQRYCLYVIPNADEQRLVARLQRSLPDTPLTVK